ncbi:helix-turn-helix domain-containing protein [Clavibacter californiensis]|uniref:helix-turn-helix domain-containing protein n=1 Tax=Clavibacter TaxID=1573 RepID=UPI0015FB0591|nr:helix-turn-helix transcriptional regulator [Clavibacter californiensis]
MAANIARVRKSQQMSLERLESILWNMGNRISFSGLSKIENNSRRVDVDDLMAIALALDVSPASLLLPHAGVDEKAEITGGHGSVVLLWEWMYAERELEPDDVRAFKARSLPGWLYPLVSIEADKPVDRSFLRNGTTEGGMRAFGGRWYENEDGDDE